MVILIDSHPQHAWLVRAVELRLREELAKLKVEINEEKSKIVDLANGGSFTFWALNIAAFWAVTGSGDRTTREVEETDGAVGEAKGDLPAKYQPAGGGVVEQINPILRGWVNYFAVGDSSECFSFVRDW